MKQHTKQQISLFSHILFAIAICFFIYTGFFCNFIYSGIGLLLMSSVCTLFIGISALSMATYASTRKVFQNIAFMFFILYMANLAILLFGLRASFSGFSFIPVKEYFSQNINLLPLKTLQENFYTNNFAAIIGNIFLLIPFGFLFPSLSGKHKLPFHYFGMLLAFSISIEIAQLLSQLGSFDVDDIFLYLLGGSLGYLLFRSAHPFYKHKSSMYAGTTEKRRIEKCEE